MKERYLIVATPDELELPFAKYIRDDRTVIVTGVGGTNVIRALRDVPRDAAVINVGYCGAPHQPIGCALWIGDVRLYHPNVEFEEPVFNLGPHETTCLTAGDFVMDGRGLPKNCVVDMELAYIAALGFTDLQAVKYVSDNLSLKQYEKRHE